MLRADRSTQCSFSICKHDISTYPILTILMTPTSSMAQPVACHQNQPEALRSKPLANMSFLDFTQTTSGSLLGVTFTTLNLTQTTRFHSGRLFGVTIINQLTNTLTVNEVPGLAVQGSGPGRWRAPMSLSPRKFVSTTFVPLVLSRASGWFPFFFLYIVKRFQLPLGRLNFQYNPQEQ